MKKTYWEKSGGGLFQIMRIRRAEYQRCFSLSSTCTDQDLHVASNKGLFECIFRSSADRMSLGHRKCLLVIYKMSLSIIANKEDNTAI